MTISSSQRTSAGQESSQVLMDVGQKVLRIISRSVAEPLTTGYGLSATDYRPECSVRHVRVQSLLPSGLVGTYNLTMPPASYLETRVWGSLGPRQPRDRTQSCVDYFVYK